jgi:hypothetical protein
MVNHIEGSNKMLFYLKDLKDLIFNFGLIDS